MDATGAGVAGPIGRLMEALNRLPGIGPKSAQRLTFHLLRSSDAQVRELADALVAMKESIVFCSRCQNVTESDPCSICTSTARDRSLLCIVEQPLDILAIERSNGFRGLYHVLHGAISPMDGIGPGQLKLDLLADRVKDGEISEVIVATNPTLEGDATALYLGRILEPFGVAVTRLARGLPVGGDLEYADDVTLARALEGRRRLD